MVDAYVTAPNLHSDFGMAYLTRHRFNFDRPFEITAGYPASKIDQLPPCNQFSESAVRDSRVTTANLKGKK